jgi:hypothetical protein
MCGICVQQGLGVVVNDENCECGALTIPHIHYNKEMGMREFETGATRDSEDGKFDYEGFLSPIVLERFGEYMHEHRKQADGKLRDSDNWQKGIPQEAYMKSMFRHFMDVWFFHRDINPGSKGTVEDALCALFFNVQGYLHEELKLNGRMD